MYEGKKIAVIMPALNEAKTIASVIQSLPEWVDVVAVGDNGSSDDTAAIALANGAIVARENRRGYGYACLAVMYALTKEEVDIIVFTDADGSDDVQRMHHIIDPIVKDGVQMVIGSRTRGVCEKGALGTVQQFGNLLSCYLTEVFFNVRYSDLGPFRALTVDALEQLQMDDFTYGWTIQMQVRAARMKMKIAEVPTDYHCRRGGKSKVSGTIQGCFGAGTKILWIIFSEAADKLAQKFGPKAVRPR